MQETGHYTDILILLGISGLTIPLLHKMRVTPVLGFLLCGFLMGPHGLDVWLGRPEWFPAIRDSQLIESFSELGIVFLMFMIGLKLSLNELWRMRHHIIGLGMCQIVVTGLIVFAAARLFGNSMPMSILLGACFSLSSTAMVMQLLEERKMTHAPVGKLSFSILLMQDLAVVPILALLTSFSMNTEGSVVLLSLKALAYGLIAIVGIYMVGTRLLKPMLAYLKPARRREWLMSFVLFVVLGAALLTQSAGLSTALGAFLAGLLLAETEYRDDVEAIISPVKNLLMGVFFLSVGMMIDGAVLLEQWFWIISSVIGIGFIKALVLYVLARAFRIARKDAAETSILLGQSGEFVFVIVTMALGYGILSAENAQFFMMVTAISMLITPLVAGLMPGFLRFLERSKT